MIGTQIKKYRTKRGLTQEELGRRIGVTTQAVSKWERGGVPDAESIPLIAKALGVSTDMLFGIETETNIVDEIINDIQSIDTEECFWRIFQYIWAATLAILKQKRVKEIIDINPDQFDDQDGVYSRFCIDGGLMDARLNNSSRYLLFMPQPENGYAKRLDNIPQLAETFGVLADKNVLRILFYMYTRKNTPVSLSLIAAKTQLSQEKAEKALEKMCSIHLTVASSVETENGFVKSYIFFNETVVLPLLNFAAELRDEDAKNWWIWFDRDKPLF